MRNKRLKGAANDKTDFSVYSLRKAFTIVLLFNVAFLLERAVFDFLGFMFGMILADMTYLLFLIVGLFGAYQYRVNYLVALVLSTIFWIAWNLFVICVYMNVGQLDRYDPYILNLNTSKKSWWFSNNIGCLSSTEFFLLSYEQHKHDLEQQLVDTKTFFNNNNNENTINYSNDQNQQQSDGSVSTISTKIEMTSHMRFVKKNYTLIDDFLKENCFLPFYWIEIIQCGVIIFCGVLLFTFGLLLSNAYNEEENEEGNGNDHHVLVTAAPSNEFITGFESALSGSGSNQNQQEVVNIASANILPNLGGGGVMPIKIEQPFYGYGVNSNINIGSNYRNIINSIDE